MNISFRTNRSKQTVQTLIRLLLEEQSDQGLHCLLLHLHLLETFLLLGHPKPKKMLIFRFVGIFEYIILLMLILFLDMCQNS